MTIKELTKKINEKKLIIKGLEGSITTIQNHLQNDRFELGQLQEQLIGAEIEENGLKFPNAFITTSPTAIEKLNKHLALFNAHSGGDKFIRFKFEYSLSASNEESDKNKITEFFASHKQDIQELGLVLNIVFNEKNPYIAAYLSFDGKEYKVETGGDWTGKPPMIWFYSLEKALDYIFSEVA